MIYPNALCWLSTRQTGNSAQCSLFSLADFQVPTIGLERQEIWLKPCQLAKLAYVCAVKLLSGRARDGPGKSPG